MSKGQHAFKQGDLTKVFKAMAKARVQGRVEITHGKMLVTVTQTGDTETKPTDDEWS